MIVSIASQIASQHSTRHTVDDRFLFFLISFIFGCAWSSLPRMDFLALW